MDADDRIGIVTEFIARGSLHTVMYFDKVKLSRDQIRTIGIQLFEGLTYLHSYAGLVLA